MQLDDAVGPQPGPVARHRVALAADGGERAGRLLRVSQVAEGDATALGQPPDALVAGGERYSVPGDRARLRADGIIELHGRDSVTINSGGEKIFAEEVEAAVMRHPDVHDAVVCGRPSEQWGQEVVALVRLRDGATAGADDIRATAGEHLARYKVPKVVVFLEEIVRSPAGKADYRWAKATAAAHAG